VLHNATAQYVSFTFDLSAWAVFAATNNFSDPAFVAAGGVVIRTLISIFCMENHGRNILSGV
jgi:hypothetical protein